MLDISTQVRPAVSLVNSFATSSQENHELRTSIMPDTFNQHHPESEPETAIRCYTSAMNQMESRPTSASNDEEPGNISNTVYDSASEEFADGSSSSRAVFDTVPNGESETLINGSCDKLTASDTASVNTPTTLDISVPSHEEPTAILTTTPDDSSGGFSQSVSNTTTESKLPPTSFHHCHTSIDDNLGAEAVIASAIPSVDASNALGASSSSAESPAIISNTVFDDDCFESLSNDPGSSTVHIKKLCECKSEATLIKPQLQPKGSQYRAAYASPIRDGHRVRTSCDSIYDTGRWNVDPDGFINEKDRAGGPYLCSLPVRMFRPKDTDPLSRIFEEPELNEMILSILEQHKINSVSMEIKKCEYKFDLEPERMPTLIITARRDTFTNTWVQACREIWKKLSDKWLDHINVEISDPSVHSGHPFYVWPMESQDPIYPVYLEVLSKISDEVDHTDFLGLGPLRIAASPNREDSELVMQLDVNYKSNRDWRCTREQILSVLEAFDLPMVGVLITKNCLWGPSGELPKRRRKKPKASKASKAVL